MFQPRLHERNKHSLDHYPSTPQNHVKSFLFFLFVTLSLRESTDMANTPKISYNSLQSHFLSFPPWALSSIVRLYTNLSIALTHHKHFRLVHPRVGVGQVPRIIGAISCPDACCTTPTHSASPLNAICSLNNSCSCTGISVYTKPLHVFLSPCDLFSNERMTATLHHACSPIKRYKYFFYGSFTTVAFFSSPYTYF